MQTSGETNLATLLSSLKASLHPGSFVFITLPSNEEPPSTLPYQMLFREIEGITVITTRESARSYGYEATFPCRMITLEVHSSLDAVGFIAIVATKLKELGIGVNPVSGFFHDHLFIPEGSEDDVLRALEDLTSDA